MCNLFFFQSEKLLLYDTVQSELEEKIRRLEEDRHSIDITSGNGNDVILMFSLSDAEPLVFTIVFCNILAPNVNVM